MAVISIETRFGQLGILEENDAVIGLTWGGAEGDPVSPLQREAAAQLRAYDEGRLQRFDLPYQIKGSEFQRRVCDAMFAIPFGDTRTYGDLAKELGYSAQAIGRGCGGNPIPIIIPCHRVLGANGKMVGFSGSGGVETKVALLRHEGAASLLI